MRFTGNYYEEDIDDDDIDLSTLGDRDDTGAAIRDAEEIEYLTTQGESNDL